MSYSNRSVVTSWSYFYYLLFYGMKSHFLSYDINLVNRQQKASSYLTEYTPNVPPSTGQGTDTETVNSLLRSLQSLVSNPEKIKSKKSSPLDPQHHVNDMNNFENYSKGTIKVEENDDLIDENRRLKDMEDFASNIAGRAALLRDGVLGLLRAMSHVPSKADGNDSIPLLKEQIAMLESELESSESKLNEMAYARNEAVASERRVRRGLYRLSNGRMTLEEVLKAVEKEDNGASFNETLDKIDGMSNKNVISSPDGATSGIISTSDVSSPAFSAAVPGGKDSLPANAEDLARLKKSLQDLQAIADARDKKIAEVSIGNHCVCSSFNMSLITQFYAQHIAILSYILSCHASLLVYDSSYQKKKNTKNALTLSLSPRTMIATLAPMKMPFANPICLSTS